MPGIREVGKRREPGGVVSIPRVKTPSVPRERSTSPDAAHNLSPNQGRFFSQRRGARPIAGPGEDPPGGQIPGRGKDIGPLRRSTCQNSGMLTGLIALIAADAPMPPELDAYLRRPDSSFTWKVGEKSEGLTTLQMTSQTWQGIRWEHDIVLTEPAAPVAKGTAVLVITGGKPNRDDLNTIRTIVGQAGLPAAVLFQIPNQPLWDRVEDDLIAHTFEKYLETGDASWPLLFPMTKSAIRAMDAVQAYTKGSSNPITKFIVTGASKRGWTTWMVGPPGTAAWSGSRRSSSTTSTWVHR